MRRPSNLSLPVEAASAAVQGAAPAADRHWWRSAFARYASAAIVWVTAFGATVALRPYIQRANFVMFWGAVLFAAYRAGLVAALAASLASVVAVNYYFPPHPGSFSPLSGSDWMSLALFVGVSTVVSVLAARLARLTEALEAQAAHDQRRTTSEMQARRVAEEAARDAQATADEAMRARADADAARQDAERAREEAEDARKTAELANEAKTHFLASMSHELRTPLNAIQGYVQLIELGVHGPVTDRQREALGRIDRAQRHLLGLVEDVLNYARLASGRVEYRLRPVRVREVLNEVLPMLEMQLATAKLTLDVRLPPSDDPGAETLSVIADREKLGQILLNLLSNAIKFTPPGGRITVEIASRGDGSGEGDMAYLRVSDSGIGIPRDKLERVFEPFVQVRAGLTRPHQGAGLGLAISRDLARGMGGDLRARSAEGVGSSFTVSLRRASPTGAPLRQRDSLTL